MHPTLNRPLWRMAERLYDCYHQHSREQWTPCVPDYSWDLCQRRPRQIDLADRKNYRGAARLLRLQLAKDLADLARKCDQEQQRGCQLQPTPVPSLRLLYEELLALDQEFDTVDCDVNSQTLSVHTEPITLEGVYLGPFEIVLNVRRLDRTRSYEVNALDPHPAASCSDTTHPHVHAGNSGVAEQTLMRWLGHRHSKMIRRYYHLNDSESQRQIGCVKLFEAADVQPSVTQPENGGSPSTRRPLRVTSSTTQST